MSTDELHERIYVPYGRGPQVRQERARADRADVDQAPRIGSLHTLQPETSRFICWIPVRELISIGR